MSMLGYLNQENFWITKLSDQSFMEFLNPFCIPLDNGLSESKFSQIKDFKMSATLLSCSLKRITATSLYLVKWIKYNCIPNSVLSLII